MLDADTARKALLDFINTHAQVHNVIDPEAERKPAGPCDRPAPFIYPSDERDVAMRPFDKKEFYALIDQYSQAMKHALSEEERHYHLDILKPNGTKPFFIRTKLSKWLFSDDMPRVGSSGAAYEKCKDTTYAFMKLLDATQDYILVTPENLRDGTLRERPQTMSDLAAALMEEPTLYPVRRQAVDNILNAGGASGPALTGGAPRLR